MAALMFGIAKQRIHYIWSIFCVSVSVWGFGGYQIAATQDIFQADFWWRITHIGVIFIPILFTHFVYEFLEIKPRLLIKILYICGSIFLISDFWGKSFIADMRWMFDQFYYTTPGFMYVLFTAFFFILVIYSHVLLAIALRRETGLRRAQIQYCLVGMAVSFAGGSLSFLPTYNINFYPVFNILAFLYCPILTYAIVKKQLFDVKILLTELLVAGISIPLLIDVFTSRSVFEYLWKSAIFIFFLAAGFLLIRSVMREIDAREKVEKLAGELQNANTELERLNQAKSDFLSIASHQLKTPLSIIKGYVSMAMEGSFGRIGDELNTQLRKVYLSNERLITLVDDLLNLSRIEEGRMQYDWSVENLSAIIQSVIDELGETATQKKLTIKWRPLETALLARVDKNKIRNVILNLVDNAIKYTEKGSITVVLKEENQSAHIQVTDTGRGIPPTEIKKLFSKFTRADGDGGKRNIAVSGFGLGLYVAKLIVRDHKGKIWAESPGQDKGASFFISLPLAKETQNGSVEAPKVQPGVAVVASTMGAKLVRKRPKKAKSEYRNTKQIPIPKL